MSANMKRVSINELGMSLKEALDFISKLVKIGQEVSLEVKGNDAFIVTNFEDLPLFVPTIKKMLKTELEGTFEAKLKKIDDMSKEMIVLSNLSKQLNEIIENTKKNIVDNSKEVKEEHILPTEPVSEPKEEVQFTPKEKLAVEEIIDNIAGLPVRDMAEERIVSKNEKIETEKKMFECPKCGVVELNYPLNITVTELSCPKCGEVIFKSSVGIQPAGHKISVNVTKILLPVCLLVTGVVIVLKFVLKVI